MYIFDTNMVSALMKKNGKVEAKLKEAISSRKIVFMSGVSHYEIKRGLLAVNATRKLKLYYEIRKEFQMLFLDTEDVFDKAAEIHANLKRRGELIQDADILIATTALLHNLILVSNDSHFQRISGLATENWIKN